MVNVQVFALAPPLEQPPDQMTSRPFVAVSVIDVPVLNVAEPVLPTPTLIPARGEGTRAPPPPPPAPPRPVAVTDGGADVGGAAGGFTANVADLEPPPALPPIVTAVATVTAVVVTLKFALVAPTPTVTLAGTPATAALPLDSVTTVA